jgi:hypothetical protein
LSFRIEHYPIDRTPEYVALSYAWEGQVPTEPINIDGRVCMITRNLRDALFTLSKPIRDKAHGYCWADAICIAQHDDAEKSSQVALMTKIYKNAKFVFVWLGMPSNDGDLAMQMIRTVTGHFLNLVRKNRGSFTAALAAKPLGSELSLTDYSGEAWDRVADLLRRTWFERAWVAQEVSVNERVTIFCGRQGIEWYNLDLLTFVRYRLEIALKTEAGVGSGGLPTSNNEGVHHLSQIRRTVLEGQGYPLLEALHNLRIHKCEMGHDKVYAALGLASDFTAGAIIPDYSKSVVDVYIDVVRYCLGSAAADHRLDFLGMVVRPRHCSEKLHPAVFNFGAESETTPTWVPDWRIMVSSSILPKTFGVENSAEAKLYDASRGSEADINIENRQLRVKGLVVDCIASISCTHVVGDFSFAVQKSWRPPHLDDKYPTEESIDKAFWCTLVADVKWYTTLRAMHRGYSVDWDILKNGWRALPDETKYLEQTDMMGSISFATLNRRLFRTQKGYMGLAPAAAAIGDKICVLFGGQVLYILRQRRMGRRMSSWESAMCMDSWMVKLWICPPKTMNRNLSPKFLFLSEHLLRQILRNLFGQTALLHKIRLVYRA